MHSLFTLDQVRSCVFGATIATTKQKQSWQVEVEEFLMGCLRLRGPATAMDMGKVLRDQTWLVQTLGSWGWVNHTLRDWNGVICKNWRPFGLNQICPKPQSSCRPWCFYSALRSGRFSAYVEGELCQVKMMFLCRLEEETINIVSCRLPIPLACSLPAVHIH